MAKRSIFDGHNDIRSPRYVCDPGTPSQEKSKNIPERFLRKVLPLPNTAEPEVVRHFTQLAKLNFSVDSHFYPLGSCTMKYNPKINEYAAHREGFTDIHPYQDEHDAQGVLAVMYYLEQALCEITGMKRFSLQPSSGAQGELCGMLMIRKFHERAGRSKTKVIIPDSAHGTNPATAAMCGYTTVVVKSNSSGLIDIDELSRLTDSETAAIMLTNPNTLGLFEEHILQIRDILHKHGALLYYDGANFNPLLGITQPALMGFDVVHLNLHKTFSTPHGCGGPGAGVVGVNEQLIDFLPVPLVVKREDRFSLDYNIPHSIGRLRAFYGNVGVLIRAYAYIIRLGKQGLLRVAHNATLNANYLKEQLKDYYDVPYLKACMHEVVFSCKRQKERGASAFDVAKRLIDYGIHPPTMYFPLIVKEALMVEPTETESKETLDFFIEAMKAIDREIDSDPQKLKNAPLQAPIRRADEVEAARNPNVRCNISGD